MRAVSLFVLSAVAASAQVTQPEELSTLQGTVVNSATGEPVRKAFLHLVPLGGDAQAGDWTGSYSASSDAAGVFAIRNISAGKYRLRASHTGFLAIEYGARAPQRAGTVLDLAQPQQMKDLQIRLTPHGVITGRVLDSDGDPLENARVQLLRSQYRNGKKTMTSIRATLTNDLGEYRLSGLVPGTYYWYSESTAGLPPSAEAQEEAVPVYYPGALAADGAAPLAVAAGTEVRAADLVAPRAATAAVTGRVVVELPGARGVPSVTFFRAVGHDNSATASYRSYSAKVSSTGVFEIRSLPTGSYYVTAEIGKDGIGYTNPPTKVEVSGDKVEGLVLRIGGGMTLTGRVRVEAEGNHNLESLRLRLKFGGPKGNSFAPGSVRIAADRTFVEDGLVPGVYGIVLDGLPGGFYLKRVRVGESDVSVSGVDLAAGASGPVDILLSPNAASLSASVRNGKTGQPAAGATVVLVPEEKERLEIAETYRNATTDQHGRFVFRNVAPGKYRVYAWEEVEATAWMDPAFMKPLADAGTAVTLAERAQVEAAVDVIAAETKP